MKAKVIKPFKGCPDGESYPKKFKKGDYVEGDLARVAVENKWAKEQKAKTPPQNKAMEAPENKSSASRPARPSRKKTLTAATGKGSSS